MREPSLVSLTVGLFVLALVFGLVERRWPARPMRWPRPQTATDVAYWFFTPLVTRAVARLAVVIAVVLVAAASGVRPDAEGIRSFLDRPTWIRRQPALVQVLAVLLAGDFISYWMHRLFHGRRLWPFHAVHHSSRDLDWLASVRLHPVNDVGMRLAQAVPLLALGFPPLVVAAYLPFLPLYALLLHANVSWTFGPLRYVLASPAFHRWHHTGGGEGRDRNFASLFPFLDLVFGTFHMPAGRQPDRFGIDEPMPASLLGQLAHPFRQQESAMNTTIRAAALALLVPALAAAQSRNAAPAAPATVSTTAGEVKVERLAMLELPWGIAVLPDGRILVTEKPGRLRIYANGSLSQPVGGLPKISYRDVPSEQGGLLDVAVDPGFATNGLVYLSYSEAAEQQAPDQAETGDQRFGNYVDFTDTMLRGGAVARGRLEGNELRDVQVIWRQVPKTIGRGHFGHRLAFAPDGKLFITSGDRMRFEPAQNPAQNLGKVVRINPDGSVPNDNPLVGQDKARGEVWSLGHRNMLAAAVHPPSGQLWVVEMGPLGGDELNVIARGKNYGWPMVSNGDNYDSSTIPDHPAKKEFEAPVRSWTPVLSPSGLLFYDGALFPGWRGNALIGGLSSQALIRLTLDGTRIANEERIDMKRRIRDVAQAPDGAILLIVDDKNGELLRLTPGSAPVAAGRARR